MQSTDFFELLENIDNSVDISGKVIDDRTDVVGVGLIAVVWINSSEFAQ